VSVENASLAQKDLNANRYLLVVTTMVACGICGVVDAQYGSIYYVGVWRCSACADWEIDNAEEWYVDHMNDGGNPKGNKGKGKGKVNCVRKLHKKMVGKRD
jgi:hypothetical protein